MSTLSGHAEDPGAPASALERSELARHLDERLRGNGHRPLPAVVVALRLEDHPLVCRALGHGAGEALLEDAIARVRAEAPHGSLVAQLGDGELVLLLPTEVGAAPELVERLRATAAGCYRLGSRQVYTGAAAGYVTPFQLSEELEWPGAAALHADGLLRAATAALHRSCERGPNLVEAYAEELRTEAFGQISLTGALAGALGDEQLRLVYQPVVVLGSGRTCGVEALLRWDHSELGTISPARFIPIAERTGLINPIGDWVVQEAAEQQAYWVKYLATAETLAMSVNVSAVQFEREGFVDTVARAIETHGIDPGRFAIELTETALMRDPDRARRSVKDLASLGLEVWLDDFGVGYSSLARLRDFEIATVKLDRSFVASLESDQGGRRIVSGVVALAHELGLRVVAEGVETRGQLEILQDLGIELGQGYYWSEPLAPHAVEAWIDGRATPLGHVRRAHRSFLQAAPDPEEEPV